MITTRSLVAFNTATASENKIHDDAVASRFGFTGGLVPGVDVFAYLAHMPVETWGREWLSGGVISARFAKPVYDGDEVLVTAKTEDESNLRLSIETRGIKCADGIAQRRRTPAPPWTIPLADLPAPEARPAASPQSLSLGKILGSLTETYTRAEGLEHIAAVRGNPMLYDDGRIANPAWLLRRANYALADNVRLGPWIHVESEIALHDVLRDGQPIDTRATVTDNTEAKGHLIVTLDVQMHSQDRLILSGRHVAIYEPRQVRSA